MANYINTIIIICLAFMVLCVSPILSTTQNQYSESKMMIHNDTAYFLDVVKNKSYIAGQDLQDYITKVNSHGIPMDVKVEVYTLAASKDVSGNPITLEIMKYNDLNSMEVTDVRLLNKGDAVTVSTTEIGVSPWRRVSYRILNLDVGRFVYDNAVVVQ